MYCRLSGRHFDAQVSEMMPGPNQRIDGGKLLCHFFERLSVVLQRENGAMLIERSPLNNLPGHVDGAL